MMGRVMRPSEGKTLAIVLDHAGNCARFWDDMKDIFTNGVLELDDGKKKKKAKKAVDDEDPTFIKCPVCKQLHTPAPKCSQCGHEYPKKQSVQHVAGTLKEMLAQGKTEQMRNEIWPQVCGYVRDTLGLTGESADKRARGIYYGLTKSSSFKSFRSTIPAPVSTEVANRIRANYIAWRKGQQKTETANLPSPHIPPINFTQPGAQA